MSHIKAHLTENHQLKAADALISKLRQELGAANAYIEELEETLKTERKEQESLKTKLRQVQDKYSVDFSNQIKNDVLYQKCYSKINSAIADITKLKQTNENLILEIIKLRNERDNQKVV